MDYLEPVDLLQRIRLGQSALINLLDPTERHLPYWTAAYADGDLVGLRGHGASERSHDVPRAIHALSMAQEATGDHLNPQVFDDLSWHLYDLFREEDNLPGACSDDTGERRVGLHSIREVTHALAALMKLGDDRAGRWGRAMVRTLLRAMDRDGRIDIGRLPSCCGFGSYTWQPHQEGRAVDALVRYYRVSQDESAVELAALMVKYALNHCFASKGTLTQEAGTHGHSITAMVAGMADFAILINDSALLERVRTIYDVGLPSFNSSFGWSMENLSLYEFAPHDPSDKAHGNIYRGESNNTGDLVRAALALGRGGFPGYFASAERILRSHLLPSQLLEVEGMSDDPEAKEDRLRSLATRVKGSFSFPTPNELLYSADGQLATYDITSGAVDALCEAWHALCAEDPLGVRANLLFDCERNGIRIRSTLPREGRVDVVRTAAKNVWVRIPDWAPKDEVTLRVDGIGRTPAFLGSYLSVPAEAPSQTINIGFPVRTVRNVESIAYKRYTIDWRGDQIVAMSPGGKFLPMFPPCA